MATNSLTSRIATILALYDLGGSQHAIDTEDIAMRAAQVAPKAFRWKRYPEQVNLEAVRLALKDNKRLVPPTISGGVRDGWQLTQEGVKACLKFRGEPATLKTEARKIRRSRVFSAWQKDGEGAITRADLIDILRVNDYFPESKRRQRVVAFVNSTSGDPELESFVEVLKRKYPEVMRT
jgi:hypothetical protein